MAQKFLSIKNFEKYQHFKKANPPWIKLYRSLFTDREFMQLPVTAKYLYIGIVMLASEGSNRVPHDLQWISQRLSINPSEIDLKPLYKAGFFIASESTVYRESISQRREETETETEESREAFSTPTKSRGKRPISEEDKPTERHFEYGKKLGVNVGPEWGKFYNYCKAHDKRYADFEAAFRNWLANSLNMKGGLNAVR